VSETYSRVQEDKNLSAIFPIRNGLRQGDALSPVFFKFVLEYTIRRVQVIQDDLKLNGPHHLLVYADDVNILGGSIHTIKGNTEVLVVASKEIGPELNADKTEYTVMSQDQNAGRRHSMKNVNCFFERVEDFKYLGTTLSIKILIRKKLKAN